jgi:hypothetical protein
MIRRIHIIPNWQVQLKYSATVCRNRQLHYRAKGRLEDDGQISDVEVSDRLQDLPSWAPGWRIAKYSRKLAPIWSNNYSYKWTSSKVVPLFTPRAEIPFRLTLPGLRAGTVIQMSDALSHVTSGEISKAWKDVLDRIDFWAPRTCGVWTKDIPEPLHWVTRNYGDWYTSFGPHSFKYDQECWNGNGTGTILQMNTLF